MAPVYIVPDHLFRRDIDLSSSALRKAFTPHPYEQRLTLYVLAGFILVTAVGSFTNWPDID